MINAFSMPNSEKNLERSACALVGSWENRFVEDLLKDLSVYKFLMLRNV